MVEIAVAVVAKLAEYLVDPLVRQGKYLFCVRNITKTLETEKQRLASTQDGVQQRVREALNKTEKVVDGVDKWLAEVESHMDEVKKLEQQMKESNSCFQGRCPTWRRYRLCRQMTKMIEETKNLNQRSEFNPFSMTAPLPDIDYFSSRNFVNFQSRKLVSDQLLLALQDNGVYMIGLYGMGGSGKTTLVKEVGKRAKELRLFDRVVFTTVSQTLTIRKIQSEIADDLSLTLLEEGDIGRAKRLSMRLGSGERNLIILDDVWAMIDLEAVGIPYSVGCKVLLTTRLREVCDSMKCDREIPLHLLDENESWTLFQKNACIVDESLDSVAQEIVSECKGLPIAIHAVGATLRGKSIEAWKEALRRLRNSKPIDVPPGIRDAFSCLQLSYDYLRSNEAKSLFMMCCMYPEDADISLEDLFRIAIGLGMCEESGSSLDDARNKVSAFINHLVDSCLLMRSEKKKDHLRMHDTIRDVALWISSQQNRTIVVNLEKDMKATAVGSIQDCYAFTSWCNQTSQFPQQLDAPKLEILLLTNIGQCELSEANLRGMGALKVMQIDFIFYNQGVLKSFLPRSLNLLPNLRTLRLRHRQLGDDLSWVLCLKRLEVLDLKGSLFKHLPQGLEELNKLKLLHLSEIKEQSFKVIERCIQLQELYASSRIKLSRTTLNLDQGFPNDASLTRLKRYDVEIGKFAFEKEVLTGRNSRNQFIPPLNTMESKNILELEFVWRGPIGTLSLRNLGQFKVSGCNNLRTIFSPVIFKSIPLLQLLEISDCNELEEIMSGAEVGEQHQGPPNAQSPKMCFPNLQTLKVQRCNKLKCLFSVAINLNNLSENILPNLYWLTLEEVPSLKDFYQNLSLSNDGLLQLLGSKLTTLRLGSLSEVWLIWRAPSHILNLVHLQYLTLSGCNELEYVFGEGFHASTLPKLQYLTVEHSNKLKSLLSTSSVTLLFPHLSEIEISECEELEELFRHTSEASSSDSVKEIVLPNLDYIRLTELPSLVEICKGFKLSATNLRHIKMSKCPKFSSIMGATGSMWITLKRKEALEIDANSNSNQLLHQLPYFYPTFLDLRELELQNLSELSFVCTAFTSFQNLSFHYLRRLEVVGCGKLKCILSMSDGVSLPHLRILEIKECEEVEEIMKESEEVSNSPFPILKIIKVKGCHRLKCLFRTASIGMLLPKLEHIEVSETIQMEELFSHTSSDMQQIELPNLNTLELSKLPALTHFCKGLNLNAPYLHNVQINECPNFDFRSHVEATSLEGTALDGGEGEGGDEEEEEDDDEEEDEEQ